MLKFSFVPLHPPVLSLTSSLLPPSRCLISTRVQSRWCSSCTPSCRPNSLAWVFWREARQMLAAWMRGFFFLSRFHLFLISCSFFQLVRSQLKSGLTWCCRGNLNPRRCFVWLSQKCAFSSSFSSAPCGQLRCEARYKEGALCFKSRGERRLFSRKTKSIYSS